MVQEQRDELVAAVHKAACDLAATRLTRARDAMADSIGVEIAEVDAEVNRLCAGLESAKAQAQDVITQLQHMHTELSGVREEASSRPYVPMVYCWWRRSESEKSRKTRTRWGRRRSRWVR